MREILGLMGFNGHYVAVMDNEKANLFHAKEKKFIRYDCVEEQVIGSTPGPTPHHN